MEVNAKLTNSVNVTATTTLTADEIKQKVEKLAQKAAKNVKIEVKYFFLTIFILFKV